MYKRQLEHALVVDSSKLIALGTPGLVEIERDLTHRMVERMRELCRRANIPFVLVRLIVGDDAWLFSDTTVEVWDLSEIERDYLAFDSHPTARWHADVGQEVARLIRDRLALGSGQP